MNLRNIVAVLTVSVMATIGAAHAADEAVPDAVVSTLGTSMPRAALSSDSIYFVMTDRYANGSKANDHGAGGDQDGFDPTDVGMFHGGDLKGLTANLGRIKRMGFTAIWMTPPFLQQAVQGSSAAYHGYWIVDFTKIDPHLGTLAEFKALVEKVHSLGMKLYLDIVMNHTADIIKYKNGIYTFQKTPNPTAWIPAGTLTKGPAWLNDIANFHNQGDVSDWGDSVQYRNGDFFGLDDIKTENRVVVDGFADVYSDWVVNYDVDGFRIDTVKHVDTDFFNAWVPKLLADVAEKSKAKGVPVKDVQMFGEVFDTSFEISDYMRSQSLPSLLDFPMQPVLTGYAYGGTSQKLFDLLQNDDFYNAGRAADGVVRNAYSLAVFGGNHDMGRIANFMADPQAKLATDRPNLQRLLVAYDVMFLMRGAPVVYYGDEVGMVGAGGDKLAREDMFPTKVVQSEGVNWQKEPRVGSAPIGRGSSLTAAMERHPIATHIRALNALRAKYPTLVRGATITRLSKGSVIAWSRVDPTERREYVVVTNSSDKPAKASIPTSSPSTGFANVLGRVLSAKSDAAAQLSLSVPARTTYVLRATSLLPATAAAPQLTVVAKRNYDINKPMVSAVSTVLDPLSVTFISRSCATCTWTALGTDDAAPYRIIIPKTAWANGTYLDVAAVSRTSDGKQAAGPVAHYEYSDLVR